MTSSRAITALPNDLLRFLRPGAPAALLSVGADGYPYAVFTWVVAVNSSTVNVAVDVGSTSANNLEVERRAAFQVVAGDGGVFVVKGHCRLALGLLESALPLAIAMFVLTVDEVRDQSWPVARVSPLRYVWADERRDEYEAVEKAVLVEMSGAR